MASDDTPITISDGMGGQWPKCSSPLCDLHVVRPGKVQCGGEQFGDCGHMRPTDAQVIVGLQARVAWLTQLIDTLQERVEDHINPYPG